jgi:hypothetical protein
MHAPSIISAAQDCGLKPGRDFRLLAFDYEAVLAKMEGVAMIRQDMSVFKKYLVEWVSNPDTPMSRQLKPELVFGK